MVGLNSTEGGLEMTSGHKVAVSDVVLAVGLISMALRTTSARAFSNERLLGFLQQLSKGIVICNIQFTIGVLIHQAPERTAIYTVPKKRGSTFDIITLEKHARFL